MIGLDFQSRINQLLAESNSTWIDLKSSFDYVYEAAKDFSKETKSHHATQTITTVASQAEYNINPDFLELITTDESNFGVIKYSDGTNTNWLNWESYSDYLQNDNPAGTPTSFCITDASVIDRITGTATSAGTQVGGESTLTDSAQDFTSLFAGDSIINVTQNYFGIVLSASTMKTAMFDLTVRGGAYADWSNNDSYVIQPEPRYKLILDPAPLVTGQTVTLSYYAKPLPVYSDYGTYPFATGYEEALIKYATFLYKYRDSKQNMGDPLYLFYEKTMRKGKHTNRKAQGAVGFRVNLIK